MNQISKTGKSSSKDVVQLWDGAVEKYNTENKDTPGFAIQQKCDLEALSMVDIGTEKNKELSALKKQRHSGDAVDRIRTRLGKTFRAAQDALGPIGGIVGCAYPPATAIAQALLFVLKACQKISDKLDEIVKFYETVQFFFERLSLLEGRLPPEHVFETQLMRVFAVILDILSAAKKYVSTGRLILFAKELVGKQDGLADAYEKYTLQMNDLESSILMLTLGTTTETHKAVTSVERMVGTMMMQVEYVTSTLTKLQSGETRKKAQRGMWGAHTAQFDSGSRNFIMFQYVLKWLSTGAELPLRQWLNTLERRYIPGTCTWLEDDRRLDQMMVGTDDLRCLLITGKSDMGKSMLAYYLFRLLELKCESNPSTSVVYFSFSDESGNTYSTKDMLCMCAMQIAEKDEVYRKDLMATINQECDTCPEYEEPRCDRRCWNSLFLTAFLNWGERKLQADEKEPEVLGKGKNKEKLLRKKIQRRLLLIIDGMDQLEKTEHSKLRRILQLFKKHHQGVVLVTENQYLSEYHPLRDEKQPRNVIRLEGEPFRKDLTIYAESRIQTFSRLWRSSEDHKALIINEVCKKADNFLYIDHAFQRLSTSKGKLLDRLVNLPETTEDMYKDLLQVYHRNPLRMAQLHCLLTWLAWTNTCITLGAAGRLIKLVAEWPELENIDKEEGLDLDEELDGKLSRVLVLSANFVNTNGEIEKVADDADEDQNSLLGLSSQLFQKFYRKQGQYMWSEKPEENPLYDISSHVLVFRMITSILTMNPEKTTTEKELVLSVSRSWLKHLGTIDKAMEELEAAIKTMEESKVAIKTRAKQIADCFFEIFESPCALKRLSREIDADNSLNINEFLLSAFESLDRCVGLCENLLITNKLVDKMSRYANGFVYISQKHICTWWSAQYPIEAYTNFRLAHFALIEAVRRDKTFIALLVPDEAEEDEEFEQFKKVSKASEQWDKGKKTDKARRFRCRAMALRYYGLYEKAVSDIENGLRVLGISDYSKIEEPVQSDDSSEIEEIFKLHDRLGRVFFGWSEDARENITAEMENKTNELKFTSKQQEPNQGHLRTALNAFNRALGYKPRGQENNQNWKEGINMTYQLKAKVEALLGEAQQCLESVDKATHTAEGNVNVPENRDLSEAGRETMLVYFNEIVIALTKLSSNENVLSLLEKVPIQQLALGCADKTHEALHQAMSKSYETPTSEGEQQAESRNNEGKKRLGKMYEEAAKRLRNDYRRLPSNLMRVWWAIFTRHTCKDRKRAKEILQEALQPVVEGDIEAITPASWQLAEILLDEFWSNESASNVTIILTERQAVYEKTKELMETVKAQVPGFQPELAQISIPLAMMHRELGSLATFKNHAYGIFDACRSALTDGLASNDQPSFQLLAKLLALIPGLEEEATVTFTCQFYTVDMERRRQEAQAELSSTSLDSIPTLQLSSRLKSRKAYRVIRRANVTPEDEIACYVECSGRCGGILTEKNLQTHKAFLCYYCTNTILCGSCHKSWEKWKGGPGQRALGVGCESFHRHVEAPAKIWTKHQSAFFGKDPKKNLENLKEWLEDLERKWEEQWIIFMKTRNESKQAGLQQL